jgi:hypothetical protein
MIRHAACAHRSLREAVFDGCDRLVRVALRSGVSPSLASLSLQGCSRLQSLELAAGGLTRLALGPVSLTGDEQHGKERQACGRQACKRTVDIKN